jgi:4'-phosphopantetheinyl transferase EntD
MLTVEGDSSLECLRNWIELQAPVAAAFREVSAASEPLWREETSLVASARQVRRNIFAAGRAAAREAFGRLGAPPCSIMAYAAGDPIWPADLVGSISHTESKAIAVTARARFIRELGLDIEADAALEPDLIAIVSRPDEKEEDDNLSSRGIDAAKLRFVAKEAAYKAIFPTRRTFIDFQEARVTFQASDRFNVTLNGLDWTDGLEGRFTSGPGWLCAMCFRAA